MSLFPISAVTHAQTPRLLLALFYAHDLKGAGGRGEGDFLWKITGPKEQFRCHCCTSCVCFINRMSFSPQTVLLCEAELLALAPVQRRRKVCAERRGTQGCTHWHPPPWPWDGNMAEAVPRKTSDHSFSACLTGSVPSTEG